MGFQQRMIHMMMGRKSPEDVTKMMGEMMPQMMGKMGREGMAKMMGEMMPQMMEGMGSGDMMETMHEMMPRMMENCLTSMGKAERQKMLAFCHTMLEEMGEKFGIQKGEANSQSR